MIPVEYKRFVGSHVRLSVCRSVIQSPVMQGDFTYLVKLMSHLESAERCNDAKLPDLNGTQTAWNSLTARNNASYEI